MAPPFRLTALNGGHDRLAFAYGEESLDHYFQTQATQNIRRRVANCFVAIETVTGQVAAYYTIAPASVHTPDLPPEDIKRLPRYPDHARCQHRTAGGRPAVSRARIGEGTTGGCRHESDHRAPASFALLVQVSCAPEGIKT
ncbi:MAG: hypothetical protein PHH59_14210 [Methylovulum sp.]|nr:hypothetical protein [Methylovulum sp.]MDD2725158.1 hypothetical protein [Methylovulum sp.]MDD5126284.1 hypothetical protein [Methylovulum sp.]